MNQVQSTTYFAIEWDIRARDDGPEMVLENPILAEPSPGNPALFPVLIGRGSSATIDDSDPKNSRDVLGSNQEWLPKPCRGVALFVFV